MVNKALDEVGMVFARSEVTRVAIVDDGYDAPKIGDVDEDNWLAFTVAVDEAEKLGRLSGAIEEIGDLSTYGDLQESDLQRLWYAYREGQEQDTGEAETLSVEDACRQLFRSFQGRKHAKLRELVSVERTVEAASGSKPAQLPSNTRPEELLEFDLVFLDFFLGDEGLNDHELAASLAEGEKRAIDLAKSVGEKLGYVNTPLFVIISGRAGHESGPKFRDDARLLSSKFRFLSKKAFDEDQTEVLYVLRQLAAQRSSSNSIEHLLRQWREAAGTALEDVLTSMRRLDVTEYGYIQHYRLESDQTSLRSYLTWLYGAYLGALVEERMSHADLGSIDVLKRDEIPPANLPPMSEVPRIYSKITTTNLSAEDNGATVPVWTGDLFVREGLIGVGVKNGREEGENEVAMVGTETGNGSEGSETRDCCSFERQGEEEDGADILVAITPVCDLVPGREKAKSIVLVGGELRAFGKAPKVSNHLLVLDSIERDCRNGEWRFQVDWDNKWPHSFSREAFDGESIRGTDYRRVGRLRELYAIEVAQAFSGDVARIGVPVAPPFTHALQIRAVTKRNKKAIVILDSSFEQPVAWELYKDRSKENRLAVFSEEFLWRLRDGLKEKISDREHECWKLLDDPVKLAALTKPFEVKISGLKNTTLLREFAGKLAIKRVKAIPEEVDVPTNREVVVLWAAGPMVEAD